MDDSFTVAITPSKGSFVIWDNKYWRFAPVAEPDTVSLVQNSPPALFFHGSLSIATEPGPTHAPSLSALICFAAAFEYYYDDGNSTTKSNVKVIGGMQLKCNALTGNITGTFFGQQVRPPVPLTVGPMSIWGYAAYYFPSNYYPDTHMTVIVDMGFNPSLLLARKSFTVTSVSAVQGASNNP
jgi:hypothetical protein